jgi:hypothetical protein
MAALDNVLKIATGVKALTYRDWCAGICESREIERACPKWMGMVFT